MEERSTDSEILVHRDKHIGQREPRIADSSAGSITAINRKEASPGSGTHTISSSQESRPSISSSSILYGLGDTQLKGVPGPSIGRVPLIPEVQFAGVSNGESLWALPSSQSPEASSDTMSQTGVQPTAAPVDSATDDPMADIDWARTIARSLTRTLLTACRMHLMHCFHLSIKPL